MPIEVEKQERENSQGLSRRFAQKVKRSGLLIRARRNRFFQKQKSRQMQKRSALRREQKKEVFEKLKKLGQDKRPYGTKR